MIKTNGSFDPRFLRYKIGIEPFIIADRRLQSKYDALAEAKGDPLSLPPGEHMLLASNEVEDELLRFMFNYARARGIELRVYRKQENGIPDIWAIRVHGKWQSAA